MSETQQHIGWLKQYLGAMTAENWKDMRDRAVRQVDELARTPAPDAVREAWRTIASFPGSLADAPDHILLWNPCDGLHLIWSMHSLHETKRDIERGIYSHWKPASAGPALSKPAGDE